METLDARSLEQVAFGPQPGGTTRVLPTISFAIDYWRDGLNPAVFKATNLTIHALTAFTLSFFFLRLLVLAGWGKWGAVLSALVMALVWTIHPLQVSSVLYVVQRMQTMGTLFLLFALLAYLAARQAQIEGRSARAKGLMAAMFWILALGCKEDSILLPAYALALELTLLQFKAASEATERLLRKGYMVMVASGVGIYLLLVLPHYWHWEAYAGRDFSSSERLLTQGRVLCMYLGQIMLPLPSRMPFYYDWLQPSRGLLQPWTTLPALLLVCGLLVLAWRLRWRRSLFALGVFLFFASHFMASNVIPLELAFEHRNHFALIGVVLAVADAAALIRRKLCVSPVVLATACTFLLFSLGGTTLVRAREWGNSLNLARHSAESAPGSARAWNSLCVGYFEQGGGYAAGDRNPRLSDAIDTCSKGASLARYSIASLTNVLIFKTIRGDVAREDWRRYLDRLQKVKLGPENRQTLRMLINNANHGVALDEDGIIEAIDIMARRGNLTSVEFAAAGYFVLEKTQRADKALEYFVRAVQMAPAGSPLAIQMIAELRTQGREEWAERLESLVHAP